MVHAFRAGVVEGEGPVRDRLPHVPQGERHDRQQGEVCGGLRARQGVHADVRGREDDRGDVAEEDARDRDQEPSRHRAGRGEARGRGRRRARAADRGAQLGGVA